MPNEIISKDKLRMYFGSPNKEAFEISPIWCEFYVPFELDDMKAAGVSDQWIQENLYDAMEEDHTHPIYTIIGQDEYKNREFLYIKCEIIIQGHKFEGCANIVVDEIRNFTFLLNEAVSITIDELYDNYITNELTLSCNDEFSDYNAAIIKILSKTLNVDSLVTNELTYTLKSTNGNRYKSQGVFKFKTD